jgi:hypothetical protein
MFLTSILFIFHLYVLLRTRGSCGLCEERAKEHMGLYIPWLAVSRLHPISPGTFFPFSTFATGYIHNQATLFSFKLVGLKGRVSALVAIIFAAMLCPNILSLPYAASLRLNEDQHVCDVEQSGSG